MEIILEGVKEFLQGIKLTGWDYFVILSIWFAVLLLFEFFFIPKFVSYSYKKYYQDSSSFPTVKEEVAKQFQNSEFKVVCSAYLRALSKKAIYIVLVIIAIASIVAKLLVSDDFDVVVFFSATIAFLEAIDSRYVEKERLKEFNALNSRMIDTTLSLDVKEIQQIAQEEEERYNKLTPFEQFIEKIPRIPIKKASIISISGKKERCNVEIKKVKDGDKDAFELLFDKNVKYVDRFYMADTAEYNFNDKNKFKITKTNNDKKYTIEINMRPL